MFSLRYQLFPLEVNSIKPNSLTNTHPPPNSIHAVLGLHNDICIEMLVVTLFPKPPLAVLISVISSSFKFAFLTSQQSCFLVLSSQSVVSLTHSLILIIELFRWDQPESVNNACGCPYVKLMSGETMAAHGNRSTFKV